MDAIQIATVKGHRKVHCYVSDSVKGLAVTRTYSADSWRLTHVASGRALFAGCLEAEPLMRAAEVLGAVGDWTRSDQEIWADKDFMKAVSREAKHLWADPAFYAIGSPVDSQMPDEIRALAVKRSIARGGDGEVHQVAPLGTESPNTQSTTTLTRAVAEGGE